MSALLLVLLTERLFKMMVTHILKEHRFYVFLSLFSFGGLSPGVLSRTHLKYLFIELGNLRA